jgi:hypothetical protein
MVIDKPIRRRSQILTPDRDGRALSEAAADPVSADEGARLGGEDADISNLIVLTAFAEASAEGKYEIRKSRRNTNLHEFPGIDTNRKKRLRARWLNAICFVKIRVSRSFGPRILDFGIFLPAGTLCP